MIQNFYTCLFVIPISLGFLLNLATPFGWAAPASISPQHARQYDQGVDDYRTGNYTDALQTFQKLVSVQPQSLESRYYLAITLAQLKHYNEARQAYQDIIKLAPVGDATAKLAQEGLSYLPGTDSLDAPPQVNKPVASSTPSTQATAANQSASTPFANMDPQTLQMMMMMGGNGSGSGGGFNPMMIPMMESMMRGKNGQPGSTPSDSGYNPQAFSTMMMNQMMQNLDPFGGSNKDN